jgi:hypothetical protein
MQEEYICGSNSAHTNRAALAGLHLKGRRGGCVHAGRCEVGEEIERARDSSGSLASDVGVDHMCCSTYDLLCSADRYVELSTEPLGRRILLIGLLHIRRHNAPLGAATGAAPL